MSKFFKIVQCFTSKGITRVGARAALLPVIAGVVILIVFVFGHKAHALTNVTDCSELNNSGETYNVINNINSAGGTCLNISADGITLDCQNFTITGNGVLNDGSNGIRLSQVSNVTVKNCIVEQFQTGIHDVGNGISGGNTFEQNTAKDNGNVGIMVGSSIGDIVISNTAIGNGGGFIVSGTGIGISGGSGNVLGANTANFNIGNGIVVFGSVDNQVIGNTAVKNTIEGILVNDSDDNDLGSNKVIGNGNNGILLLANSVDNFLKRNIALRNLQYGYNDFTSDGFGVRNIFEDNKCASNVSGGSNLTGLCTPQP